MHIMLHTHAHAHAHAQYLMKLTVKVCFYHLSAPPDKTLHEPCDAFAFLFHSVSQGRKLNVVQCKIVEQWLAGDRFVVGRDWSQGHQLLPRWNAEQLIGVANDRLCVLYVCVCVCVCVCIYACMSVCVIRHKKYKNTPSLLGSNETCLLPVVPSLH